MYSTDGEIEAPTTRLSEDSEAKPENDRGSQGTIGATSPSFGNISERVRGTGSSEQGPIPGYTVNGKILTQLIQDCDDRLEEAEACLQWYENVKQRELKRRENLRQLQELEEQERQKQQAETEI